MRVVLFVAALCLAAGACATAPLPAHQPTLANVQLLRAAEMPAMALGEFAPAPGLPSGADKSITIRLSSLSAPGGSFSLYLRQTLEAELTAAGKLDNAAPTRISALLTKSEMNSDPPNGHSAIAARFMVTRDGATVYERELDANQAWDSSFIGAIAIPEAINRYNGLYPQLVTALLSDPQFREAVRTDKPAIARLPSQFAAANVYGSRGARPKLPAWVA